MRLSGTRGCLSTRGGLEAHTATVGGRSQVGWRTPGGANGQNALPGHRSRAVDDCGKEKRKKSRVSVP
eukprot:scaffold17636_cov31-Phaeocystis_antarctica.AAC.2